MSVCLPFPLLELCFSSCASPVDRFPGRRIDGCWRRLPFKMPAGLFRMVRFLVVAEGVIFLPLHVKNMLRMEVRLEKGVRMELGEGHEYALVKVIADGAESLLGGFGCRAGGKDGKKIRPDIRNGLGRRMSRMAFRFMNCLRCPFLFRKGIGIRSGFVRKDGKLPGCWVTRPL